jgi:O-antigen biosynthesis protein WbqP
MFGKVCCCLMTKRIFEVTLSFVLLIVLAVPCIFVSLLIKVTSQGPILYWSNRIGIGNKVFSMPKFRSMHVKTPVVASEELKFSEKYITSVGRFLRISSFDEVPQLYSVLVGDMSLVGPRPALYSQISLIKKRTKLGVSDIRPGITGLAQVMARNHSSDEEKVELDLQYLNKMSLKLDIKILFLTVFVSIRNSNI